MMQVKSSWMQLSTFGVKNVASGNSSLSQRTKQYTLVLQTLTKEKAKLLYQAGQQTVFKHTRGESESLGRELKFCKIGCAPTSKVDFIDIAPRAQFRTKIEGVFRNVNSPTSSLPSKTFTSLGGRSCCSKPDHSCPVAQNQTKSNLRKVVFKYVCVNDESQEASRPVKPIIRKVLEIPSVLYRAIKEATELISGQTVSEIHCVEASHFKERIRRMMNSVADAFNVNCTIGNIEKTEDSFPNGKILRLDLDDLFKIRVWEIITGGDKHVLDIIMSELKRNGFALRKIL
ncbi:hypothetical protein C5167_019463 [Papaver somniferum]|uniref:Uncharacterized protein n=1 Tax=Papaver somniferum TaxID=3469 RepID=A0A4Y7IQ92_PAPSO|nr:hypothetical protein C5167_019463 [Papaver somniferum]